MQFSSHFFFFSDFIKSLQIILLELNASDNRGLDTINNIFYVQSKNPNGSQDQYNYNDLRKSSFEPTPIYPTFFGLCIQTNSGGSNFVSETSWDLYNDQGNTVYTSGTLLWGTQYRDSIFLGPGCYRFEVHDTDDDGLDFWANNDGSGIVRFITTPISCNAPEVKYFEPDFGKYIVHEFRVENTTSIEDKAKYPWKLFPNPTDNSIQLQGYLDQETTISIYNNIGELLMTDQLNFEGVVSKVISLNDFPTGVYFVNIQNTKEKIIKKVVKL